MNRLYEIHKKIRNDPKTISRMEEAHKRIGRLTEDQLKKHYTI